MRGIVDIGVNMGTDKQYYTYLVGRIYKLLPLYEEDEYNFKKYAESLYIEMCGNDDFPEIKQLKNKIHGMCDADLTHDSMKRTVFECINIVNKIVTFVEGR